MIILNRQSICSFVACLCICLLLGSAWMVAHASEPIRLTLKDKVVIETDTVRLRDVASLSGTSTGTSFPIMETIVAKSPPPGQTRFVGVDYIRIRLRQAGIHTDTMIFKGAQDVQISRQAATLPRDRIVQAVESAIRQQMPWPNEDVTIQDIDFDEDLRLPTGRLSHRIIPKRNEDYLGQTILALHFFVDGELVKKTWVNATITVMADVVKVIRPLGKRQTIEMGDVTVASYDLATLPSDTVRSIQAVVGQQTAQMIYPHTVLRKGMIRQPTLVKRGDIVKIVANVGPMTITATGQAKQQGGEGKRIHVINTDSKRVITARVIGPGAVEVDF